MSASAAGELALMARLEDEALLALALADDEGLRRAAVALTSRLLRRRARLALEESARAAVAGPGGACSPIDGAQGPPKSRR